MVELINKEEKETSMCIYYFNSVVSTFTSKLSFQSLRLLPLRSNCDR